MIVLRVIARRSWVSCPIHAPSSPLPHNSCKMSTRKPCYRKDDHAMRPAYVCFSCLFTESDQGQAQQSLPCKIFSLPKISPCSPGSRWLVFGLRRAKGWANCACSQFPRFPTYVILIHQRYRQTGGRTTCNRKTEFCTIVHRAVKMLNLIAIILPKMTSHCASTQHCTYESERRVRKRDKKVRRDVI